MAEVSVTPEQLQQRDDEAAERKSLASTATSTVEASGVRDPSHSETSSITEFSHSVTVFVSDMSGFTSTHFNPHDQMSCHFQVVNGFKINFVVGFGSATYYFSLTGLTRKYGIIHYAGLIMKLRQLFRPILQHYNALYVTTEADDVFAVFKSPVDGVKAAFECLNAVQEYNNTVPDIYQIKCSGIGLSYGSGLILEQESGRLFGVPFEEAFHIGEDLSEDACVFVSSSLLNELQEQGFLQEHSISAIELVDADDDSGSEMKYYRLEGRLAAYQQYSELPPALHDEQKHAAALIQRTSIPPEELADYDKKLTDNFMQTYAVVMFGIKLANITSRLGAHGGIQYKNKILDVINPIFKKWNSIPFEESLHAFTSVSDAVNAVLEARDALSKASEALEEPLTVSGFGIHVGKLLHIPGTDIHWGDPVNTASKLGEDLAKKGEVYLSTDAMAEIKEPWFEVTYLEEEISGAQMKFYQIL